mgnify:CR=1 FL=1
MLFGLPGLSFALLAILLVLLVVILFINTGYSNYLALSEAFVFMGNHKMINQTRNSPKPTNIADKSFKQSLHSKVNDMRTMFTFSSKSLIHLTE